MPRVQGLVNIEEPTNIFNFNDEIDFWNQMLESEPENADYKRIFEYFKVLESKLSSLQGTSLAQAKELVDIVFELISDLQQVRIYPVSRITLLLDILS